MARINFCLGILIIVFFSLFTACGKSDISLNDAYIIGHGGMGISSMYPMNSLESFIKAMSEGADGVEIDVQMTKDGVLVAYHDEILDDRSTAKGIIENYTWAELKIHKYTNYPYLDYAIVKLEDVLDEIKEYNPIVILDIKKTFKRDEYYQELFFKEIRKILTFYQNHISFIVESKNAKWLKRLKEKNNDIITLLYGLDFEKTKAEMFAFSLDGLAIEWKTLENINEEEIKNAEYIITTFNLHSLKQNKKALKRNIPYLQTENIKGLRQILNR